MFIPWHNLAHFGIPYLCPFTPLNEVIKAFRREWSSYQVLIKNHDPGRKHFYSDTYVTTSSYYLIMSTVHLQMALSNVSNCT